MINTRKRLQVVCLSLAGDKDKPVESVKAFTEMKNTHFQQCSWLDYKDSYGYPMMCIAILATSLYKAGQYTALWEQEICKKYELKHATTYETVLDFDTVLFDGYEQRR